MTLTKELLGQRLRQARENVRMTQEMAALELGLERTILQKMESGVRKVTSTELASLAKLYRRDMSELVTLAPLQHDPFTILGRIASNVSPSADGEIATALERLKEAVRIEEFLGGAPRIKPMMYECTAPSDFDTAIMQGKEVATLERSRLGLGNGAISDVAEVIASQGIWIAAVPLPEQTSGLFVSHARYGLAIFVNQAHHRARRRFSYAHEYAHALLDRSKGAEPSTIENMRTLTEKRANSFASEFLLPAAGVTDALERMRKGGTSRTSSWTYDIFTDDVIHVEVRHDASAQHISTYDVAFLAHAFRVSYEMAAIRLKDLDFIKKPALDRLLSVKEDGRAFMKALNLFDTDDMESQPYLERQLMALAVEAFRRDKISRGRFVSVCALAGQDPDHLLGLVMRTKDE